jgi:N-acetylglucosamine-6-sulfatase
VARRVAVLLVLVLGLGVLVAAVLTTSDGQEAPAGQRSSGPTPGQRSGIKPAGFEYERPRHRPEARRPGDRRPNVVLITTDDQALTDMRWMPLTRRWLGRGGVTFRNMLSPHPLCCPARAEIITGQFAQNNGVHTNAGPYGGLGALEDPDNTIADWLQRSGYLVGLSGKYLNQYDATQGVRLGTTSGTPPRPTGSATSATRCTATAGPSSTRRTTPAT